MNFSENWYTSSHWHKNNTGKVSWTSEVWFQRYEKVLNTQHTTHNTQQTTRSGPPHSHRRKLFVGDKNTSLFSPLRCVRDHNLKTISLKSYYILSNWDKNWYGGTAYLPLTAPRILSKSDNFYYHFHHTKDFNVGLQNCGLKESVIGFHWTFCLWRYGWNNEKSMTVLKLFQRSIFWALFQRSKLSLSSNNPEINANFSKLCHFFNNFDEA